MIELPQIILETANFHGGDISKMKQAVREFSRIDYPGLGIKFHAFRHDKVMLPDFSWYERAKGLCFDETQWREIICLAHESRLQVWLDLFCVFGVRVLRDNLDRIRGVKLQPSVLGNCEMLTALKEVDLGGKDLIINVSGLELSRIEFHLKRLAEFSFETIALQLGFQGYPTEIKDTSLEKLRILRAAFPDRNLGYADHLDAESGFSKRFPVYAFLSGCSHIEKHICNSRKDTDYDFQSALEAEEVKWMVDELKRTVQCLNSGFITDNEKQYYLKTIQKPVARSALNPGSLIADADVVFRRTDKAGIDHETLKGLQKRMHVLGNGLKAGDTFTHGSFKKARIAVIVAARMRSSRLKEKAVLLIHGTASIERCLENCLKFDRQDEVILATSTNPEDAILADHTLAGRVRFWQGDPEDVISRYLGACEKYHVDVVVRVTGDCPIVSPEIMDFLLRSHFEAGADFTEPRVFAVGSNSQIYNVEALKRVISHVGKAEYSEHMTFYMTSNPDIFKLNTVDLPPELVRDYRLTLDYREDLDMLDRLYERLDREGLDSTLINAFKILDANPEIARINASRRLVYQTDEELIRTLKKATRIKRR
jgi:N,N'-diacetyllegionaminate synthase